MRAILLVIACLVGTNAWAQSGGTVSGRITDETGGALPGVTVELRSRGEPTVGITDGDGRYSFDNVAPGTYQLSIRLINFATVTHDRLVVTAGTALHNDDVLHLSLNAEVVVVGKRTFVNLADAVHPAEDLVGIASSASQGAITAKQLDVRPFMRQGEVLETVPGVIIYDCRSRASISSTLRSRTSTTSSSRGFATSRHRSRYPFPRGHSPLGARSTQGVLLVAPR